MPSLNTPFTADGAVDFAAVRRLIDHAAGTGCGGVLALAVASERRSLSAPELDDLAACILDAAAGRLPVIISVSAASQGERLHHAEKARSLGADAILCQVPDDAPSPDVRRRMLAEIADAGPDTLFIQDLDWQGPGLPVPEITDLFESIPRFWGLKIEVVPAGPKYTAVLAATGGRLHVSGGWAVQTMPDALARGVHAFMPTEMEAAYVAIWNRWHAGHRADAEALFDRVRPVLEFSNRDLDTSIRFFKKLRRANGLFATDVCRPPTRDFGSVEETEAARWVVEARRILESV